MGCATFDAGRGVIELSSQQRQRRAMPKQIVIIGGGVIGLCTAWYCRRAGHEVTLIERNSAVRDGCSFGNAGMIVPSHFVPLAAPGMVALGLKWMWNPASPFYIKPRLDPELLGWGWKFLRASTREHVDRAGPLLRDLSLASRALFEELHQVPGHAFGLVRNGLLMLCKTEHALREEAAMAEKGKQLGISAEVLDPDATARIEPGVRMDVAGSVYFPGDCHLSPSRFMAGLTQLLTDDGVRMLWNTAVRGWRQTRGAIQGVETTQGMIEGDEYVICGGSWSPSVAQGLRMKLPMQAGKGYSLTLDQPRQLPKLCAIFTEARVAVTPMGQSLRFGGTMEIAGLDESINPVRVRGIIDAVPRYYPDFRAEDFMGVSPWRGLRPCTPDGLPYVGRTRNYANLSVATGHGMLGLSLGPITGKLMARIISGEATEIDLALLNPDRYA
jgi:D-amino-acid dehydrogenase